ncbi:hypothetical protein D3C84_1171150 [compost metagenome]
MTHDLIEQDVRLATDFIGIDVQRQAVLDLGHLLFQTVPGQRIQLMGQGEVRKDRQKHHQQCAENTHRQTQAHRQAGRLHSRASST